MDGVPGGATEMAFTSYEFDDDELVDNVILRAGDVFVIVPDPLSAADFMVLRVFLNDQLGLYEAVALVTDTSNTNGLTLELLDSFDGSKGRIDVSTASLENAMKGGGNSSRFPQGHGGPGGVWGYEWKR